MINFYYRAHNSSADHFRVWRSDWAGDQFEIMDRDDFYRFEELVKRFGFSVTEAED